MSQDDETAKDARSSEIADEENLAHRLDALGRTLDDKTTETRRGGNSDKPSVGYGQAVRLSSDFIAGIIVGAALGWGFDKLFETSPWGLIVFLFLGFGAGIMNVLRTAGVVTEPAVRKTEQGKDPSSEKTNGHRDGPGE